MMIDDVGHVPVLMRRITHRWNRATLAVYRELLYVGYSQSDIAVLSTGHAIELRAHSCSRV
jgi:hypothetical protein